MAYHVGEKHRPWSTALVYAGHIVPGAPPLDGVTAQNSHGTGITSILGTPSCANKDKEEDKWNKYCDSAID